MEHIKYKYEVKNKSGYEESINKFAQFKKVIIGYYDYYMKEGSSLQYYFVGRKLMD